MKPRTVDSNETQSVEWAIGNKMEYSDRWNGWYSVLENLKLLKREVKALESYKGAFGLSGGHFIFKNINRHRGWVVGSTGLLIVQNRKGVIIKQISHNII